MTEDLKPSGDVTTKLIKNNKKINAKIISKQNCIIGGLIYAKEVFKYYDKKITIKLNAKEGKKIKKGKVVAIISGKAKTILKSERVALNFLSLIVTSLMSSSFFNLSTSGFTLWFHSM